MTRVCVCVDGNNFYHGCQQSLGRTDVDFGAFVDLLVRPDRTLLRAYYYNAPLPPYADEAIRRAQRRFFAALQRMPYFEVRLSSLVSRDFTCEACGHRRTRYHEKGVDMRIGIDMLATASKGLYDVAVLVSGDGDLVEAVKAVKDLGKHVELATFPIGLSAELATAADVLIELSLDELGPALLRHADHEGTAVGV